MLDFLIDDASTFAGDIDGLIVFIAAVVGFWFLLAQATFIYLIVRFRAQPGVKAQYITGELKHEKRWVTIPHALVLVCDVFIIIGAINVWVNVKQTLPEPDVEIRVIGQQWAWTFQHPGPDNVLDTEDDIRTIDELHVEVGQVYHFHLESTDVIHSFSVPVFRLKQDAIPGRVITGWFEATRTGDYDIQCAEICGIGHGIMDARIHIESHGQHAAWVAQNSDTALAAAFTQ
jgi:cytochrome c oxidase subunit 2